MAGSYRGACGINPFGSVLVIGFGNPGRRDDGLGPLAAERVERLRLPRIVTHAKYQLAIEDAGDAAEFDTVVFVDAMKTGRRQFVIGDVPAAASAPGFTSHLVSPQQVVAICKRLYGHTPQSFLIGIRGYQFGFGDGLSPRAAENLDAAIGYLCESLGPGGLLRAGRRARDETQIVANLQ
jgi:hydrogenase maturation protease